MKSKNALVISFIKLIKQEEIKEMPVKCVKLVKMLCINTSTSF